jgi:DNA-binding transcriptional ArsR family regulator
MPSAQLLAVLVEPTRRRILDLLLEQPKTVNQLVGELGTSQPSASKHLRVLREAGLVHVHPDAQRRIYALRPHRLAELDKWLAPYRRLWEGRLDALEQHLDQNPDPEGTTR